MKFVICILLAISSFAYAHGEPKGHEGHEGHEGHGEELALIPRLSDASVLQLDTSWKNQNEKSTKLSELNGKPRLLVMLYTRCETACPLIVEDLKQIYRKLDSKKIEVSIFSFDSFKETPKSLLDFATKRKLPSEWMLYTADANAVSELAAALGVRYKRLASGDFIHSNVIFYLNDRGEIAAQKEGLKTSDAEFIKQIRQNMKAPSGSKRSRK